MKLKEINDKVQEITNKIKATKDKALKNTLIQELIDFKKTITFDSVEDWKDEYQFNDNVNKSCWEQLTNEEQLEIDNFNLYYDLYYKTKSTLNRIKKQYDSNIQMLDAVIEALSSNK